MELLQSLRSMAGFVCQCICPILAFLFSLYMHRKIIGDYPRFWTIMATMLLCMFYLCSIAGKVDRHYCKEEGKYENGKFKQGKWKDTEKCKYSKFGETQIGSVSRQSVLCLSIITAIMCYAFVSYEM